MPLVTNIQQDYLDAYDGYNSQAVGIGLATGVNPDGSVRPNIYATPAYAKSKVKKMAIGLVTRISYAGAETDMESPYVLTIGYEPAYGTVIGYNLRYVPQRVRRAMLKFVLESNAARIKANQPILIDYYAMKRAVPQSRGAVRRYKVIGINIRDTYTLNEWVDVAKIRSPYENVYKAGM